LGFNQTVCSKKKGPGLAWGFFFVWRAPKKGGGGGNFGLVFSSTKGFFAFFSRGGQGLCNFKTPLWYFHPPGRAQLFPIFGGGGPQGGIFFGALVNFLRGIGAFLASGKKKRINPPHFFLPFFFLPQDPSGVSFG